MNHYDEHIIELYVLRSASVEDRREDIERHLSECHGCRSLAGEIETFYRDFEKALAESKAADPVTATALTRRQGSVEPWFEPYTRVEPYRPATLTGKVRHFIRRYPIATGAGSFAFAAALAGLLLTRPGSGPSDTNPSYSHLNPEAGTIDIYNASDEKIREIPTRMIYGAEGEQLAELERRITVTDLDGDGVREVLIGMAIADQGTHAVPLNILWPDGKSREIRFVNHLEWKGSPYADTQSVERFAVSGAEGSADREIYATANNVRSPTTLYRLSKTGEVLGQYNHFGSTFVTIVRWPGSGREEIVAYGQNDTGEPDSLSFPVMIVLDPSKITGRSEASDSRGFGLPLSGAERYVIRLPLTQIHRMFLSQGYVRSIVPLTIDNQPQLEVSIGGTYTETEFMLYRGPAFNFYFDREYRVVDVKYDSPTMKLRKRLIEEGKLPNDPVEEYLSDLKGKVRYWNGTEWQKEITTVHLPPNS